MFFQSHYDPITGSYFQEQNRYLYSQNEKPIYGSFIPRPSPHDQVQLGKNAFGRNIYLDTGLY